MSDTIDSIANDIRYAVSQLGDDMPYIVMARQMRSLADDIVAAHKREVATSEKSSAVGDAAKLREALEFIKLASDDYETYSNTKAGALDVIYEKACAALAAPPRNCDKYATADEALKAQEQMFNDSNFANGECKLGCPECDNPRVGCKIAWLFAPATEKEGGGDAD